MNTERRTTWFASLFTETDKLAWADQSPHCMTREECREWMESEAQERPETARAFAESTSEDTCEIFF